jgi:hypothetical protein
LIKEKEEKKNPIDHKLYTTDGSFQLNFLPIPQYFFNHAYIFKQILLLLIIPSLGIIGIKFWSWVKSVD